MATPKEIFARNLREMLEQKNETRIDFAKAIGVTPTAVNDWIHAKRHPRPETIERIAAHFNCDKGELINELHPAIQTLTPQEVGSELQKLIAGQGMTPAQVDEQAEIKAGTTAKIIKGKYEPRLDVAAKIASILKIPTSLLLGISESKDKIQKQKLFNELNKIIEGVELSDEEIKQLVTYTMFLMMQKKNDK